jgi:cytochrome c peroxidase
MHNGYLKSLKEVVHFYNTRDVLPRCQGDNTAEEKVSLAGPGSRGQRGFNHREARVDGARRGFDSGVSEDPH